MTGNRGSLKNEIPAHREPWRHLLVVFGIAIVLFALCFLLFGLLAKGF